MATKILYIEDETQIRDNVTALLSLKGYEVAMASNGREGISQAMQQLPDLILCDIMMPQMDGYQVLEVIRGYRSLATVPFIFLTAKSEEADLRRGMILGADDYLTKPFTLESLLLTIESRLQRETLREADLQTRLEALRHTMTSVSHHEYNTPLNGILGFTTLLLDHYSEFDQEDGVSMLSLIKVCSLRLKRYLDNLSLMETLRQVEPGHTDYAFFTTGFSRIDTEVMNQQIQKVDERHDEAKACLLDVDSAYIALSEQNLRIILDELIDNAHKFSTGVGPIQITGRKEAMNYRLVIGNRGRLFKPEDIARIAPYVQFDRKIYEQQGSGVGLAIVKKILDLNNGLLSIDSLPIGETSVMITLLLT